MAILSHPGNPSEATRKIALQEIERVRPLRVRLHFFEVNGPDDFERVFTDMSQTHATGLAVVTSLMLFSERKRLVELAERSKLAAVYPWREPVDAGGLLAYGANLPDLYRRAATFVDKILKGARPADMPVEPSSSNSW